MSDLTLLSAKQCFGAEKLGVLKKRGTQAKMKDFAILQGVGGAKMLDADLNVGWKGIEDDDTSGRELTEDEIKMLLEAKRATYATMNRTQDRKRVINVNRDGKRVEENGDELGVGLRLVLPYSSISENLLKKERAKDGVLEVQYGYYPQDLVRSDVATVLEAMFKAGAVRPTGNNYTVHRYSQPKTQENPYEGQELNDDYGTDGIKNVLVEELEFEGKRYVRYLPGQFVYENPIDVRGRILRADETTGEIDKNADDSLYEVGKPVWVEVSPIKWLVDEEADLMVTEDVLLRAPAWRTHMEPGAERPKFADSDIKAFLDKYVSKDITQGINEIELLKSQNAVLASTLESMKEKMSAMFTVLIGTAKAMREEKIPEISLVEYEEVLKSVGEAIGIDMTKYGIKGNIEVSRGQEAEKAPAAPVPPTEIEDPREQEAR